MFWKEVNSGTKTRVQMGTLLNRGQSLHLPPFHQTVNDPSKYSFYPLFTSSLPFNTSSLDLFIDISISSVTFLILHFLTKHLILPDVCQYLFTPTLPFLIFFTLNFLLASSCFLLYISQAFSILLCKSYPCTTFFSFMSHFKLSFYYSLPFLTCPPPTFCMPHHSFTHSMLLP